MAEQFTVFFKGHHTVAEALTLPFRQLATTEGLRFGLRDESLRLRLRLTEHVVRLTGDCPLVDPGLVDRTVLAHREEGFDYTSTALERTYPDQRYQYFVAYAGEGAGEGEVQDVVGCAMRTPPHKLLVTDMPVLAARLLTESVLDRYEEIPAVLGPPSIGQAVPAGYRPETTPRRTLAALRGTAP